MIMLSLIFTFFGNRFFGKKNGFELICVFFTFIYASCLAIMFHRAAPLDMRQEGHTNMGRGTNFHMAFHVGFHLNQIAPRDLEVLDVCEIEGDGLRRFGAQEDPRRVRPVGVDGDDLVEVEGARAHRDDIAWGRAGDGREDLGLATSVDDVPPLMARSIVRVV